MDSEPSLASTAAGDDGSAPPSVPFAPRTLLRDGAVAGVVVAGLYGLLYAVPVPPFAVPGYLLVVAFDVLEAVLPPFASSAAYDAAFAGFLAALSLVAAGVASWSRTRGATDGARVGAGAALAVVGAVALLLAAGVFVPNARDQVVPLLLVSGTGLAMVAAGRYLAFGRLGRRD